MQAAQSRFNNLYKQHGSDLEIEKQAERRTILLANQKRHRREENDSHRKIQEFVKTISNQYKNTSQTFKNHLQQSEWLREKPVDIENWYLVPCPSGVRGLLVASDNRTTFYSIRGHILKVFRSGLPGDTMKSGSVSILDCIYVKSTKEYYVLDVLVYNNQDLVNCETSFRFFWINSKIEEENLSVSRTNNKFVFKLINYIDCTNEEAMQQCFLKFPFFQGDDVNMDGFLFYHKNSFYIHGKTPLVGWLYPFMVPELFPNMQINIEYERLRPDDYQGHKDFAQIYDENKKNKDKNRRQKKLKAIDEDMQQSTFDTTSDIIKEEAQMEYTEFRSDDVFPHIKNLNSFENELLLNHY